MSGTPLELDCRGMLCPQPIIELAGRLREVAIGEQITVLATDPAARYDVPAWCRIRAQEYLGSEPAENGSTRYRVRRLS